MPNTDPSINSRETIKRRLEDARKVGSPVLTNKVGGLFGTGIIPMGLKCVREVRQAVGDEIPIIGMGGIRTVRDIEEYAKSGATIFGIGSGLAGMTDEKIRRYFSAIVNDLRSNGQSDASLTFLQEVDMNYRKVGIEDILTTGCDFKIFKTNISLQAGPEHFLFLSLNIFNTFPSNHKKI